MALSQEEIEKRIEKEKSLLFYKTMSCQICGNDLKWRTIKSGRLRVEGTDPDMRQHYYGLDANKYHVIACPHCGYTALERYFTAPMPALYHKLIKEALASFTPTEGDPEIITYRQAFSRYHAALTCASAKGQGVRASEIAYICLKTAYLLRGEREELIEMGEEAKGEALLPIENRFLQNAYDQFVKARMSEDFPMCGMDQPTLDYLVAALAMGQEKYGDASKLLSGVVTSLTASPRLKDKARELREKLAEMKALDEE